MGKIVLSTIGSLGDLHPMLALGLELKRRGHTVVVNTWRGYEEKILGLGLGFVPLRPDADPEDHELHRKVLDEATGPEYVIRELVFGNIRDTYADLTAAIAGADLFITGELIYAAPTASEILGVKWVSTSLSPLVLFSSHDPNVYPQAPWLEMLRPLPAFVHDAFFGVMRLVTSSWREPLLELRRELGLNTDHDPMLRDKFSPLLHLVMFSRALGGPQPDWPARSVQVGACYFDESETASLDPRIEEFFAAGEAPIVFTLGSAAALTAGNFFSESVAAAKSLGRRALILYGRDCEPPPGLDEQVMGFDYAPYSLVFPRAACVVHQAGVGTTVQALRAAVPQLIVPFAHDQHDNAARCRRAGVAEIVRRGEYNAKTAAKALDSLLSKLAYRERAARLKAVVDAEHGTRDACDAIEEILSKKM